MREEIKNQIIKRAKSFCWRAGAMTALAVFTYLANIADVREIDYQKLLTIGLTALSALIVSELTKYKNRKV